MALLWCAHRLGAERGEGPAQSAGQGMVSATNPAEPRLALALASAADSHNQSTPRAPLGEI